MPGCHGARRAHALKSAHRPQPGFEPTVVGLDGVTGELWEMPRYIRDLRAHPSPTLSIDEIAIHVAGDTATVSARTRTRSHPGRQNRYLDTYTRRDGGWVCVHACVWRLPDGLG